MRALLVRLLLLFPAAGLGGTPVVRDQLGPITLGSGEVYAGGDPRLERLESARRRLTETLAPARGPISVDFCAPVACDAEHRSVCRRLDTLTASQREACAGFIRRHAETLHRLAGPRGPRFVLSAPPLQVLDAAHRPRTVAAATARSATGPVTFHEGTVEAMAEPVLLALIVHELGHKIAPFPDDDSPARPFADSAALLDAVGAAIALRTPQLSTPPQEPPDLPETFSRAAACRLAVDEHSAHLVGLAADVDGTLPVASELAAPRGFLEEARARVRGERGRRRALDRLFLRHLLRSPSEAEASVLTARFAAGEDYRVLLATIFGAPAFTTARQTAADDEFVRTAWLELVGTAPTPEEVAGALSRMHRFDRASWVLSLVSRWPEAITTFAVDAHRRYLNRAPTAEALAQWRTRAGGSESWESLESELLAGAEYRSLQRKRWSTCPPLAPPNAERAPAASAR